MAMEVRGRTQRGGVRLVSDGGALPSSARLLLARSQVSPEDRPQVWVGEHQHCSGALAHLRNLDNVGLLDKPGRLVIGISNQDRDFFCHLQRGKGDRSWESEAF